MWLGTPLSDDSSSENDFEPIGFDAGVLALQQSLAVLAKKTHLFGIDPGPQDGLMSERVADAIVNSFDIISAANLSYWRQIALKTALLFGAGTKTAQDAIVAAAPELAAAALAAAGRVQTLPNGTLYIPEVSWYQTPFGIGAILIGLIVGAKLLRGHHASG